MKYFGFLLVKMLLTTATANAIATANVANAIAIAKTATATVDATPGETATAL